MHACVPPISMHCGIAVRARQQGAPRTNSLGARSPDLLSFCLARVRLVGGESVAGARRDPGGEGASSTLVNDYSATD